MSKSLNALLSQNNQLNFFGVSALCNIIAMILEACSTNSGVDLTFLVC